MRRYVSCCKRRLDSYLELEARRKTVIRIIGRRKIMISTLLSLSLYFPSLLQASSNSRWKRKKRGYRRNSERHLPRSSKAYLPRSVLMPRVPPVSSEPP